MWAARAFRQYMDRSYPAIGPVASYLDRCSRPMPRATGILFSLLMAGSECVQSQNQNFFHFEIVPIVYGILISLSFSFNYFFNNLCTIRENHWEI